MLLAALLSGFGSRVPVGKEPSTHGGPDMLRETDPGASPARRRKAMEFAESPQKFPLPEVRQGSDAAGPQHELANIGPVRVGMGPKPGGREDVAAGKKQFEKMKSTMLQGR